MSQEPSTAATEATARGDALTVIEPGRSWTLRLGELWRYRELLYFFIWRDLKVRYKQTAIGAAWAIIQPVALTVVFSLFLGQLRGISPEGIPYALYVLAGIVPWTLFSQTISRASESLVASANLLQKVYFPRLLLPISSIGVTFLDYVIGLAVLLMVMLLMGLPPGPPIVWLAPLTCLAAAIALAIGVWLSAFNVRYRDVRYVVPFLLQVWFFATPVIYSAELVPSQFRALYFLNPMAGVVAGFRWALLGEGSPPLGPVAVSVAVTAIVLTCGLYYFRRAERGFADVV